MSNAEGVVPFDVTVPNVARIYDYLLGGKNNYEADRRVASELQLSVPDVALACQQNRGFLQRTVRYLAGEAGIRQFIDIGSGLPTVQNTHQIALDVASDTRVVYVDYDQVVVAHGRALLEDSAKQVVVVEGDLRSPGPILGSQAMTDLIDFTEPVAILLVAILHFIRDAEDPYGVVGTLKSVMAPGSYLVISHATNDYVGSEENKAGLALYEQASAPIVPRSHAEILHFFDRLELVEPGLVDSARWRGLPRRHEGRSLIYGGVGRKP
jgi:hypothetical protein